MSKPASRRPDKARTTRSNAGPSLRATADSRPGKARASQSKPARGSKSGSPARKSQTARQTRGRASRDGAAGAGERSNTKQAQVLAMLQRPKGATIEAIMQATGWRQHSVRGFLAGVVRKRLGLDLQSEREEGGRVYRIGERTVSSSSGHGIGSPD
jgi:hypothetical protein